MRSQDFLVRGWIFVTSVVPVTPVIGVRQCSKVIGVVYLTRKRRRRIATAATSLIEKTPGVCGGKACVRNMRIAVWMLVLDRNLG